MINIRKEVTYWLQALTLPIYWLSYAFPRNKKIWVCGSTFGNRFADNPRYFFLYLNQNRNDAVKAVWISRNRKVVEFLQDHGYEAYDQLSIKGIWYSLRAKVYLYDNYSKDICFLLSGGAIKVNLWHGIPLKKINMDNKFDYIRNPKNLWGKFRWGLRRLSDEKPSHYVLTTSKNLRTIFSSAFQTKKVLTSGYPRNDVLVFDVITNTLTSEEQRVWNEINDKAVNEQKKIVLYMPTFRNSEEKLSHILDFKQFDKDLMKENILFCVKLHPKSRIKNTMGNTNFTNIYFISDELDSYAFLKLANILVTDYSSIYFDYLLLNKPIVFFNYDMEDYLENSRELYFNYDEFTPGDKVRTMNELYQSILCNLSKDSYEQKRSEMKSYFFEDTNTLSSEKLYLDILAILRNDR